LNLLDYFGWSVLEAKINAEAHTSVKSLTDVIQKAFDNLDQEMINRGVDNWMKRLDAVIKAKGGYFE
jgi:hypothetical protein